MGIVAGVDVPGTDALEPGDLLRLFMVGHAYDMPLVGTGCGKQTLKLDGGDHIGVVVIGVDSLSGRIVGFEARCKDDGTHVQGQVLVLVIVVDGAGRTFLFTCSAFTLKPSDEHLKKRNNR